MDASKTLSLMFSDRYTIPQVPLWLITTELRYIVTPHSSVKTPRGWSKPRDEHKWCIKIFWFVWPTSNSWKWYGYHLVGPEQTTLVHNNAWLNQARASTGCYMFVTNTFRRNKMVTSQAWPNKNKPWLGSSNTWPNLAKIQQSQATATQPGWPGFNPIFFTKQGDHRGPRNDI